VKYLVLLIVFVLFYAWWRSQRTTSVRPATRAPLPAPQDIVACARCGVHVPRAEALTLGQRSYCCIEHQREDGR